MYIPSSTYRIQLSENFRFKNLKQVLGYLKDLGISTIYASPILQSRPGSVHGYDTVNPEMINPEIGDQAEFEEIGRRLNEWGMSWLQDIVPNHMAFHHLNNWLYDILEKGPQSRFYHYFDINWNDPDPKYHGKVMAPFLGGPLEEVLTRGEIQLVFNEKGFQLKYYENAYPVNIPCYEKILRQGASYFTNEYDSFNTASQNYESFIDRLESLTGTDELIDDEWNEYKKGLYNSYSASEEFKNALDKAVELINQDHAMLFYLIERQYYILEHWQTTEQKINYRRFFTINDLICLDINNPEVFERYHRLLKKLVEKQLIQGLRIDHIDGLFNPGVYLQRLKNHFGEDIYITVEKILEWEESLPLHWPGEGATGYVFMATVSHLFTDWQNKGKLTDLYHRVIGDEPDYRKLVTEKKRFILTQRMGGELNNLFYQMKMLNLLPPAEQNHDTSKIKEALAAFLIMHPVYRIYPTQYPLHQRDVNILRMTYNEALEWKPELKKELDYIFHLFTETPERDRLIGENKLYFLMRCQQFTGPLEAKGVEDTTFYLYNRLVSHNEVGDSPDLFGISHEEFHERMIERQLTLPHALSATATHDTKRGEDMRLRINVISELPEEWEERVMKWRTINRKFVNERDGKTIPEPNDEYFIYQTLCGAMPMSGEPEEDFSERIRDYMMKVMREGKVNSNWSSPNQIYEFGVFEFINKILDPNHNFLDEARPFIEKIARIGMIYSLAQTLLKATAPGVPDIYQGCELWDLSLVDPDNRRPVDFELRTKMLTEIMAEDDLVALTRSLLNERTNGKIKLYVLHKALRERGNYRKLFEKGRYIPAQLNGELKDNLIGFYRHFENQWSLTLAANRAASLAGDDGLTLANAWGNTAAHLPAGAPAEWRNVFTGEKYRFKEIIKADQLFANFPIAFLTAEHK